ncbi:hypothetical protein P8605_20790, partial [Streptomyces sp. T-3]|nr:hypothetical protein [Streptomyces sp. T-3]
MDERTYRRMREREACPAESGPHRALAVQFGQAPRRPIAGSPRSSTAASAGKADGAPMARSRLAYGG